MNKYRKFLSTEVIPYIYSKKKPISQQFKELWSAWRYYKYIPYQYFKHRLYEAGNPYDYLGYVPPKIIDHFQLKANPEACMHLIDDKSETDKILRAQGIPCAGTTLLVDESGALMDGLGNLLPSIDEALAILAEGPDDLFIKPIDGGVGNGTFVLNKADIDTKFLKTARNILIQPQLKNHPDLGKIFNGSLNTVRIDTLIDGHDVALTAACLKVGTGKAIVDNWAKGGIAIGIELEDGSLAPTGITKAAFGRKIYKSHPDTNVNFEGIVIPFWAQTLDMARNAARAVRPHVTLGWDIAITPTGPVVLEANQTGDFFLLQEAVGPLRKSRLADVACELWLSGKSYHP